MNLLATKEINALGSFGSVGTDWERALNLMSNGVIQTNPLISLDLPLSDWKTAFDGLESKSSCKAILRPEN
jgi:threonine dehydrogenase-like Zn-dependent dehydrogenase